MTRWLWLVPWFTLAAACARPPDATAIRAAVAEMRDAAEARDSAAVLAHVSADFVGNDGEVDRDGVAVLLRAQLLARQRIGVRLGRIDVELSGERATASFDATLTDASGRWIPRRTRSLRLATGWRRENREWHCYNARWSASGP